MRNGSPEYGDSKQKCHISVIKSAVGRKKYISEGEQMTCTIIDNGNPLMKVAEDFQNV